MEFYLGEIPMKLLSNLYLYYKRKQLIRIITFSKLDKIVTAVLYLNLLD